MKKKLAYISLSILPMFLFFLEVILKHARGEFYLFGNYDGPYGYLLGSLNIAQFLKPGYFQHPGIVTQIIEAIIIKISYLLQGVESNIVLDTFNRPEFYFNRINVAFNLLSVITLFSFGKVAFEKTGNIFAALFLQLTPFISIVIVYELTHNASEATALVLILIFLIISICYLYENALTRNKNLLYILLFGFIGGLIIANVISYLPLLIIPFLLIKKFRNKLLFIFISLITFSYLFFSISPASSQFWNFVILNIIHSGKYGAGSANFVDLNRIKPTIDLIYNQYFFFGIIYLAITFTLLLQFIPKFKIIVRSNKYHLLLIGIFIIMSSYILLVIKQIEGYYLFPGLLFSVTGLFIVNSIISDLFPKAFKVNKYLYLYIIFIIFTIPQIKSYKNYVSFFTARKIESYKMINYMKENYPNSIIISSDWTSGLPTAFYNGLNYTGAETSRYDSLIYQKYPNYIYFPRWRKDFAYLWNDYELKNRLNKADSVIFHSYNDDNFNDFFKKIDIQ